VSQPSDSARGGDIRLDEEWLRRRGLPQSDPGTVEYLLRSAYEVLEWLVGQRIAGKLTREQLAEFEGL
jgi:hypothetical protein